MNLYNLYDLFPYIHDGNYMKSSINKTVYDVDSYYNSNYNQNKIFKIYIGIRGNTIFNCSRIIIEPKFKNQLKITFSNNSIIKININNPIIIFFCSAKNFLEDETDKIDKIDKNNIFLIIMNYVQNSNYEKILYNDPNIIHIQIFEKNNNNLNNINNNNNNNNNAILKIIGKCRLIDSVSVF
jgi:hypothetical protein